MGYAMITVVEVTSLVQLDLWYVQIKSRLIISQQFNDVDFLCKLRWKTPFNVWRQNKPVAPWLSTYFWKNSVL